MSLLVLVTVDLSRREQSDSTLVDRALLPLGLRSHLPGSKGTVTLPPGTWAGILPGDDHRAAEQAQKELTEAITLQLTDGQIACPFFVSVAAGWSWHYRPLPRQRSSSSSEDSSSGRPAVTA